MAYDSQQQPGVHCPLCGGVVDVRAGRCMSCGWSPAGGGAQAGALPTGQPMAYQQVGMQSQAMGQVPGGQQMPSQSGQLGQIQPNSFHQGQGAPNQGYAPGMSYGQQSQMRQAPSQTQQFQPQPQSQAQPPYQSQSFQQPQAQPSNAYGQQATSYAPVPAQQQPAAASSPAQPYPPYVGQQQPTPQPAPAAASVAAKPKPKFSIGGIIASALALAVVAFACLPWIQMSETLSNMASFSGMDVDPSLELAEEYPIWGLLSLNGTLEAYSGIVGFYAGDNDTVSQLATLKIVVFVDVVIWGICVACVLFFAVRTVIGRGSKAAGLATSCYALAIYSLSCMIVMPMIGDIIGGTTVNVIICLALSLACGILASIASRKRKG